MQDKELFKEFVTFCQAQPEDKFIDHSDWSTCAMGEFAGSKNISLTNITDIFDEVNGSETEIDPELDSFVGRVIGIKPSKIGYDIEGELISTLASVGNELETYGEFTEFVEKFL